MNLLRNLVPAFGNHDSGAAVDVAAEKSAEEKKAIKSQGPQRLRYMTAGQVRRMHERSERAAQRKMNRRRRRAFMDTQQSEANIRGQIAVLKRPDIATEAMRENIIRDLERKYAAAPVEEALARGWTTPEAIMKDAGFMKADA